MLGLTAKLETLQVQMNFQKANVNQYSRAIEEANNKLSAAQKRHAEYAGKLEEETKKHESLKTALQQARQERDAAIKTYGKNSEEVQKARERVKELREQEKEAGKAVKDLESKLSSQQKTMQSASDKAEKWKTKLFEARAEVKSLESQIAGINPHLDAFAAKMNAWSTKYGKAGKTMQGVGKALTGYVTTPIVALGGYAIKSSIEFEDAFADVRKTVDATEEEYLQFAQTVKNMSLEVPSDTNEISEVMATAGRLGIYNENLADYTKTMIDLGEATNIVANDAAEVIAQFFNITDTEQNKARNFGSTLVELGNNFATTESSIMYMALRLAGAGEQIGLTEAQILGFATALSSVGIEAEAGGSAFSKVMTRMQVAVETGDDSLEDFARVSQMTSEQFVQAWQRSPAEAIQAFIVGLSQMDEQGVSAIVTLQEMGLTEVRLRDTLLRATNANELFTRAQETANQAWQENTALTEEAEKRYSTTASQLEMLKNRANLAAQELGDELAPAFNEAIDWAGDLIDQFMELDTAQKEQIIKWAGIAAAAGPAVVALGKVTTGAGQVFNAVGKLTTGLGKSVTAFNKAGGGAQGFAAALGANKVATLALVTALGFGIYSLLDWASGAKAAREATEAMTEAAREFQNTQAQTIFDTGNDPLERFGLSKESFQNLNGGEDWLASLIETWTDGKKETAEIVNSFIESFAEQSDEVRAAMEARAEMLAELGVTVTPEMQAQMDADYAQLQAWDEEIAALLKKRRNGLLTEEEEARLSEIVELRAQLRLEYVGAETDGYESILKGVEAEIARATAEGAEVDASVFADAMSAAAQGYGAVNAELDAAYDKQYALIQLMEEGEEKDAALSALNERHTQEKQAATEEYAQALQQLFGQTWDTSGMEGQVEALQALGTLISQYEAGDASALTSMADWTGELDEGKIASLMTLITQLRDLGYSDAQLTDMFGIDPTSIQNLYTQIAEFAQQHPVELEGLDVIFSEAVPDEVIRVLTELDLTEAAAAWERFKEDKTALDVMVTATLRGVDGNGNTFIVTNATVLADGTLTGVDGNGNTFTATNCSVNADGTLTGVDGNGNTFTATGATVLASATLSGVTGENQVFDVTDATANVTASIVLTGLDKTALQNWRDENGNLTLDEEINAEVGIRFGADYASDLQAAWEEGKVTLYDGNGLPIDVDPSVPVESVIGPADIVAGADEDGTLHIVVAPKLGTAEAAKVAAEKYTEPLSFMGSSTQGLLQGFNEFIETADMYQQKIDELKATGETFDDAGYSVQQYEAMQENHLAVLNADLDELSQNQGELQKIAGTIAAITAAMASGEISDEEGMALLAPIQNLLGYVQEHPELGNIGTDITAGIASGLNQYDGWNADASTLATDVETAIQAALQIHSPSQLMIPHGEKVSAGIGEGMKAYAFSGDAGIVANNARAALSAALPSSALRPIGLNAMLGMAAGIRAGQSSVVSAMRSAARAAVAAAKSALKIQSPSRVFRDEVGVMIMRGLGEGVESELGEQRRIISNAARYLTDAASASANGVNRVTTNNDYRNQSANINIGTYNANSEEDVDRLARRLNARSRSINRGYGHG